MAQYIVRRLLLMIPTLIGVSLLITGLLRLLPADAVDVLVAGGEVQGGGEAFKELVDQRLVKDGKDPAKASITDKARAENALIGEQLKRDGKDPNTTDQSLRTAAKSTLALNAYKDNIRQRLGLNKNYIEQWSSWAWNAAQGDLGTSIIGSRSVSDELKKRIPVSIELGVLGMLVSVLIALPLGVASAVKQDGLADYGMRSLAIAALALPSFFIATIIIAVASRFWNYSFPVRYADFWDDPKTNLELVVVPAVILGIGLSGTLLRLTRAQMLEVLRQDYIRTARAKGLRDGLIVIRHALRNALIPVVTLFGLQVGVLFGGTVVLESIFTLPGLGGLTLSAVRAKDYTQVQGLVLLFATVLVLINLVVDLSYAWIDPRIRYS